MKRILILMLALVMCVGVLAACTPGSGNPSESFGNQETNANGSDSGTSEETDAGTTPGADETATLADAAAYLNSLYKDGNEITERDFDVVGRVLIGGVSFTVTWTVDSDKITIKESTKQGFYTVDLPDAVEEETAYVLTATIADADGKTEQKTFKRKIPVINNVGIVTEPVENTAYKFFMKQANVGKTLFALGEMSGEKYIKSTNDAKAAPDFFAEPAEGGYKFYTTINDTKTYINARTTTAEDGKVSKYLELSAEAGAVWSYDGEVNAWLTTIDGTVYCVGTYSSYDTFCISEKTYITAENTGVSQFPAGLMTKEVAESLTPDEGPDAPTDVTSIADFNAIAEKLAQDAMTPEKYLVKGVITEIKNDIYGNLYIRDEAGNQLYIYGAYDADGANRFDKMNPQPKVGDTITVMGVASNYNGPQMKNGWITEIIPGEGGEVETDPPKPVEDKTIPAFNEIASAQPDKGDATADKYSVTGTITEIKNTTYGNLYIEDEAGNRLYIYGIYDADGKNRFDAMDPQPKVGDTITVVGVACNYNGPQMKNGWVVSLTEGEDPNRIPAWDENKDVITHLSFDELRINGDAGKGVFTPGQSAAWNKVATLDETATCLHYWGWAAYYGETGMFGYSIDDGDIVYNASFAYVGADHEALQGQLAATGGDVVHRMLIVIDLTGLSGKHTVKTYYKSNTDKAVQLTEFTVEMPAADTPDTPEEGAPVAGTAYKLYFIHTNKNNAVYYLNGKMASTYYLGATQTFAEGVDYFVENTEGGYYLYGMIDGAKKYINVVKSGTHTNAKYEDAANTVYAYDATLKTLVATIEDGSYILGTAADKTYDSLGPVKADSNSIYARLTTKAVAGGDEKPGDKPEDKPTDPTPSTPVSDIKVNTPYYISGVNAAGALYFDGTINSGRINGTSDKSKAVTVQLEAAATAGEYYICFMNGGVKTYIAGVEDKSAGLGLKAEKDDTCVWLIDANARTIISKNLGDRGIATQVASTYNNFSSYAASNFESAEYSVSWFAEA